MKMILAATTAVLATVNPAFAFDTSVFFKNGIMASVFVGFLALIVVIQLVPALMLLMGCIKALIAGSKKKVPAVESTPNKD